MKLTEQTKPPRDRQEAALLSSREVLRKGAVRSGPVWGRFCQSAAGLGHGLGEDGGDASHTMDGTWNSYWCGYTPMSSLSRTGATASSRHAWSGSTRAVSWT